MKRIFALFLIFLFALSFSSCGSDDDSKKNSTPTYSISGTIMLASDSTALANITVALSGDSSTTTTTGTDGTYTFTDLEAGDYTITPATATGYTFEPESSDVTLSDADITGQDFAATKMSAATYLHYTFPDQYSYYQDSIVGGTKTIADEATDLFSSYTATTGLYYLDKKGNEYYDITGYQLDQFVLENNVIAATPDPDGVLQSIVDDGNDPRGLYAVVTRSSTEYDGFSNRSKFVTKGYYNSDLRWDQYSIGYLLDLNYSGMAFYLATNTGELIRMYNSSYATHIYMFRKIDVVRPDGSYVTFEPQATTDNYVDDTTYTTATTSTTIPSGLSTTKFTVATKTFGTTYTDVKAISLDQFLTDYVQTNTILSEATYKIDALDGTYQEGWTYTDMQNSYYLVDLDLIIQVDSSDDIVSGSKINYPVKIEVIDSAATSTYDYSTADPPAYTYAYDEITAN